MEPAEVLTEQLGTQELLLQIIEKSDGVAILFTIIILIGIVIGGIPILKMLQSHKKSQNASDLEERKLILEIVQQNTEAVQALKNTLNISGMSTNLHLKNIEKILSNSSERITSLLTALKIMDNDFKKTIEDISIIKEKTDIHINSVAEAQRVMVDKLEKIDDMLVGDVGRLIEKVDRIADILNVRDKPTEVPKDVKKITKIPK